MGTGTTEQAPDTSPRGRWRQPCTISSGPRRLSVVMLAGTNIPIRPNVATRPTCDDDGGAA